MVSLYLYTGLIAVVGLERLLELRLSVKNAAWAFARGGKEYGLPHYRFMTVFHTLFLVACVAEPWVFARPFVMPWGFVALGLAIAAQALRYWAITTLGPRWNTRVIVLPEAAPVTGGPYRFVRHPNYVAVVLELLVLPLIHSAWVTAIVFTVVNALLLRVRVKVEEEALGTHYAKSFANTPRMVPGTPSPPGRGLG
ncbi:MAG: isoprenylcysteine carboxylmethyltransferase family protein [Archangium sp.]|nr:isoprenylcysteine carboxylmethyltransferase family protein [Archangium sp.]